MSRKAIAVLALMGAAGGMMAAAPVEAEGMTRSAEAHVHGHGTLNIAVEGQRVLMELEVPGADVLGFEHAAESEAEKSALKRALADLQRPMSLFVLPDAAGCRVQVAEVAVAAHEEHHENEHEHEKHAEHAAEKAHADEDAEHAEAHEDGHREVHAEYALHCTAPSAIDSIRFVYFDRFARAEELDVNLITANGQRSFEVTRARPVLGLQGMM